MPPPERFTDSRPSMIHSKIIYSTLCAGRRGAPKAGLQGCLRGDSIGRNAAFRPSAVASVCPRNSLRSGSQNEPPAAFHLSLSPYHQLWRVLVRHEESEQDLQLVARGDEGQPERYRGGARVLDRERLLVRIAEREVLQKRTVSG